MLVHDQIARNTVKQSANVLHHAPARLRGKHADITLLGQISRNISVLNLAAQKVQQLAVKALQHQETYMYSYWTETVRKQWCARRLHKLSNTNRSHFYF